MARAWIPVLVGAASLVVRTASSPSCQQAVNASLGDRQKFMQLSLSTGKSLPKDAGKYDMCMTAENTRYFLVTMSGQVGSLSVPMEIGFCLPHVCNDAGAVDLVKSPLVKYFVPELDAHFGIRLANITSTSPQVDLKSLDKAGVAAASLVGFLLLLVSVSTAFTVARQTPMQVLPLHQQTPGAQMLLQQALPPQEQLPFLIRAFSMLGESGTLKKLLEIPPYKPTDSLNGFRVLSMFWIILGHTFLMPEGVSGYANQENIVTSPLNKYAADKTSWLMVVLGAQAGVDSFFFLSGFLLAYLTLKELRAGKMRVVAAVVLRYVRLTPSLALVMLVFYKIWYFLASGPFSPRFQEGIARRCDATWWSELTYTMNFINSDNVCMGWSWYLGDDMIFFIVSIAILPIYHKKPWMGWVTVTMLSAVSFCVTAWLVFKYGLTIYAFDDHYKEYSFYAYSKPYTRVPAYFVGLAAAWLLDEMEQKGITRETKPNSAFARWSAFAAAVVAVAVLVFLTLIVGTDFGDNTNSWDQYPWVSVLYIDFSRPIWAVCCAVITLLCYYDYLPLVNGFLSHPFWTPLARLSYGAYLVHPLVIKLQAGMAVQYYTFTGSDIVSRWFGNCVMAYSASVVLWCLVERPCMTIFAPPRKPQAKKVNSATPSNVLDKEELDADPRKISRTNSWNSNPEIPPTLSDALSCSHTSRASA